MLNLLFLPNIKLSLLGLLNYTSNNDLIPHLQLHKPAQVAGFHNESSIPLPGSRKFFNVYPPD